MPESGCAIWVHVTGCIPVVTFAAENDDCLRFEFWKRVELIEGFEAELLPISGFDVSAVATLKVFELSVFK